MDPTDDLRPLLLFFDCEAAAGNVFRDDIIEVALKCQPDLHPTAEFDSLIHTRQRICSFGQENGLTARVLEGQPRFPEVLDQLLDWCDGVVEQVNLLTNCNHYPVLVAHGGELFDFLMLFSHCERHNIPADKLQEHNIHFADTFIHLDEVKQAGHQLLDGCPLSLDFLLNEWFPGEFSEGRHRAMVDVKLLIKVFYQTPLHKFLATLPIFSTEEWYEFYKTKKEIKKDKREFGDHLSFLNEVERKFAIRSLVKNGLNYEGLKDLYQQCRSVEHFTQEMRDLMETNVKTLSIRKIADHFMCKNVPQLGTIPYQPRTSINKYQPACYHETDATGTHFRLRYGRKSNVRPSLPSQQTQEESPPEGEEADPDSSSYPVGTSVPRGVTPASRGVSPAARGRGRARPLGARARDAGWVYNPLHKQVPVEFGNHDDGWLSDGDSAAYSPDDVLHVYVQQPKVTTTLVPREGRSTIFDIDDVTASQGDHEKGHMKRQNTGMSFSKIKKELEKSTTVVRGKGARRRHVFQERSEEDAGKKSEERHEESQGGRGRSLRGKTSEKFKKSNDSWRMSVQTCASRHETKRSSEDRGERSSTRPPVSTYAQVLTGEKTQRDGDANEVTSTPKESVEKEARMKSEQEKQNKGDRQCRSQNNTRDCSEKQAAGRKTSEHDTKEEESGWAKKKGRHWSGKKVQCKKTWGKNGHMAVANNSKESGLGNEAGFHQSSPKKVEPQTLNRRGQEQWPTLFKQKPEIERQRHHSERNDFGKSMQQPRGEMKASFAKGPSSRDGEKCRSALQGKLPKSNYDKQDTNQRLRSAKSFSKKQNCSCGLPHEGDIPKANTAKTSRVVGSGRISEPPPHPPRRNREQRPPPSSAKYGILSTQDGRKKRDGPKDGKKRRDGPKKDPKEDNLDLDVSIEELLPFKNSAYKYLFTPGADMDASTAENYDKLIFHYNQEYFRHKQGD